MASHTARQGQRVDKITATDDPHELYRQDGTPVLRSTKLGQVVEKSVTDYTVTCPECNVSGRYSDDDATPTCPRCGLVLTGTTGKRTLISEQLVRDAKAAGRVSSTNDA